MENDTRGRADFRRRHLLRSSAALLAVSAAGLTAWPVFADEAVAAAAADRPVEPMPAFVKPREAWGAAPPARPYVPHTPSGVIVHHSGAAWYGRPAVEQYLRNIQAFHTGPEREWEDIAYHFLIDLEGGVWAGRPPEVRGNPSVYYESLGQVLICFLGDYDLQPLSAAQLSAATSVAAWLLRRFKLAPTSITGHHDHAPTACPGASVQRLVQDGTFGGRVRELLASG